MTALEFRIRHPSYPHHYALYGVDGDRGVFGSVHVAPHVTRSYAPIIGDFVEFRMRGRVHGRYDITQDGYDGVTPARGLLLFIADAGFFDVSDVELVLFVIRARGLEKLPRRFRRIGDVVRNLDVELA